MQRLTTPVARARGRCARRVALIVVAGLGVRLLYTLTIAGHDNGP
jgi:hypothetical protein